MKSCFTDCLTVVFTISPPRKSHSFSLSALHHPPGSALQIDPPWQRWTWRMCVCISLWSCQQMNRIWFVKYNKQVWLTDISRFFFHFIFVRKMCKFVYKQKHNFNASRNESAPFVVKVFPGLSVCVCVCKIPMCIDGLQCVSLDLWISVCLCFRLQTLWRRKTTRLHRQQQTQQPSFWNKEQVQRICVWFCCVKIKVIHQCIAVYFSKSLLIQKIPSRIFWF